MKLIIALLIPIALIAGSDSVELETAKAKLAIREAQLKVERLQRQSAEIQKALELAGNELIAAIEAYRPADCKDKACTLTDELVWQRPKEAAPVSEEK